MPTDLFPQQLGPYVLLRLLGAGGMGDVYLALAGRLGMEKPCVVKRLAQHSTSEDGERFRREATLARKLSHGAIAQTLAVDEIDGELIIAQELLHGRSLSSVLATCLRSRDHLPSRLAVHIAREVARALSYAHEQGVTHRDIAPDNVMLTFTGEVRLLDFGIARTTSDPRLTRPGWSVGREAYAAPEVAAGGGGDSRSDIYSLGVLLWQLLARRPPPANELLTPASRLNHEVSPALDAIVARAAAPNPGERFERADDVLKALGAHLPADFAGHAEIASFLQKHHDLTRERELLETDLGRGRAFLLAAQAKSSSDAAIGMGGTGRRVYRRVFIGAAMAAVLLASVAVVTLRGRSFRPEATRVVAPPSRPSEPPEMSRAARPTAPVSVSGDVQPASPATPQAVPEPRARGAVSDRARVMDPSPPRPSPSSSAELVAEARQRFDVGDVDGALRSARAAVRAGGGAPARVLVGQMLAKRGQLEDAERELVTAIRQDPSNAAAADALRAVRERIRATSVPR